MLWVRKRTVSMRLLLSTQNTFELMGKEINAILGSQTILSGPMLSARKPVFGVCVQAMAKTETSQSIEILHGASLTSFEIVNNKVADQNARMHRLICAIVCMQQSQANCFLASRPQNSYLH